MDQAEKDKIIHKLIDAHRTISTMESCTAGLIASTITDTEGASAIFSGGYVTYLNETKVFKRMCRRNGKNSTEKNENGHCHRNNRNYRER